MKIWIIACSLLCSTLFGAEFGGLELDLKPGERVSLPISYKQMICLEKDGVAILVMFSHEKEGSANYRYRLIDLATGEIKNGTGKVFESYNRNPRVDGGFDVTDAGSKLEIAVGGVKLEWSYGDKNGGYLYFEPEQYKIKVFNAAYYEKLKPIRAVNK